MERALLFKEKTVDQKKINIFQSVAGVLFFALSFFPVLASAQVGSLTEESIRDFVMQTSAVMDGTSDPEDGSDVRSYLEMHLSPEGLFKSEMTYNIPGHPVQKNQMALDREQFIDSVIDGRKSLSDYRAEVSVQKVEIANGGRRAEIQTRARESGKMTLQTPEGGEETLPVEGISICQQTLILDGDDVIRIHGADCRSEMSFAPLF